MKKRGRKRSSTQLPVNIKDPGKLPTGVWFNNSGNGRWMLDYHDPVLDKKRSKKIAGPKASMAEIWQAYDANTQDTIVVNFKSLSNDFQKSHEWRDLKYLTQKDYLDCHQTITNCESENGEFLGDLPIGKWSTGLVRRYRDYRAEQSRSRANKELGYINRVLNWAYGYEKVKTNPAKGIPKLNVEPRKHYAEDRDYRFLLQVAYESNYWYMPIAMEIAYLCRMRLSEVLDLTDANELESGLLIKRRKGSKDNIVAWNDHLKTLWTNAKTKRKQILTDRRQPQSIRPEYRYIFISERTGDKILASSLKTAKSRIDRQAREKAEILGIEYIHFTFHDLKRKGITDTSGNKLEASGHRNASMLNIYDVKPAIVKPAGEK